MLQATADPPSEASAVKFKTKKMEASDNWNFLYPSLRQFQDINGLCILSSGIQYIKTYCEYIKNEIVTNMHMYWYTHTSEWGGHLGFIYPTGEDSRGYSQKLLKISILITKDYYRVVQEVTNCYFCPIVPYLLAKLLHSNINTVITFFSLQKTNPYTGPSATAKGYAQKLLCLFQQYHSSSKVPPFPIYSAS